MTGFTPELAFALVAAMLAGMGMVRLGTFTGSLERRSRRCSTCRNDIRRCACFGSAR